LNAPPSICCEILNELWMKEEKITFLDLLTLKYRESRKFNQQSIMFQLRLIVKNTIFRNVFFQWKSFEMEQPRQSAKMLRLLCKELW
jgi:hypothetical protein